MDTPRLFCCRGYLEMMMFWYWEKSGAVKIEVYKGKGRLRYRAEFKNMLEIQGYRVPVRLDISNDKGDGFSLEIDRYRANVSVSPSVFVLKPPSHIDRQDSD
jgi:hypothetical protein